MSNIRGVNDSHKIPIVTKKMFRKAFPKNVIAQNEFKRALYDRTSGSTGEPFEFYKDERSTPKRRSSYMLFNTWMGVGPHEKHLQISSPKVPTKKKILSNKIFRKYHISSLRIKRKNIRQIVSRINDLSPIYLEGYSASLYNTAYLMEEQGLELVINPKAVIATSEDLIEPYRKKIQDVFKSPVYNRYGSREFSGAVAQECDLFEGSHVNSSYFHVDLVDDEGSPVGDGERGRIIITDLHNRVMPFIRYDLGDSAIKGPEKGECGRTFPIIKDIKGKSDFFLISKNDERIPIETIQSYLFQKYAPNVNNFQFLHNKKGDLILYIIPAKGFTDKILQEMHRYFDSTLVNFTTSIELVEEITHTKAGKTPYFIVNFSH
ncbi:MAG: hypothetical protein ACXAB7_07445 [Candidatus Kariarchaeaceae archaeon]